MFTNKKKIYPLNDPYISIYKLHYKPFYFEVRSKSFFKKQIEFCKRMSKPSPHRYRLKY